MERVGERRLVLYACGRNELGNAELKAVIAAFRHWARAVVAPGDLYRGLGRRDVVIAEHGTISAALWLRS